MQHLVLALKLVAVPAGLGLLAMELLRDERLGSLRVEPLPLLAALAVNQLALSLFAVRMQGSLRVFGMALGWLQGLRVHLQSMFYFFALPMTVGLEVARFAKIRSLLGEQASSGSLAYALLADRIVGAAAALVIALVLLPFVRFQVPETWGGVAGWVAGGVAAVALAGAALLNARVGEPAAKLAALLRTEHGRLASTFAIAIVTHGCFALAIYLAAAGAGIPVGPVHALFAVSAAMLFVVVPVSFAGVSPVEAANFGAMMAMGFTLEQGAVFAFVVYLAKLVAAIEGAAWEIAEGGRELSRAFPPGER